MPECANGAGNGSDARSPGHVEGIQFHELSSIFPLLEGDEFEQLKADIARNGLRDPITLYRGKILDGRNRYRACRDLGIKPRFQECDGDDSPLDLILSRNLHRRHLTKETTNEIYGHMRIV